jgi:hypothetical protein
LFDLLKLSSENEKEELGALYAPGTEIYRIQGGLSSRYGDVKK